MEVIYIKAEERIRKETELTDSADTNGLLEKEKESQGPGLACLTWQDGAGCPGHDRASARHTWNQQLYCSC